MKAKLTILFVLVSIAAISEAAIWTEQLIINPDFPNKCYSNYTNQAYEIGSKNDVPGKCQRVHCVSQYELWGETCSPFSVPPGCWKSDVDFTKPFPKCCQQMSCDRKQ